MRARGALLLYVHHHITNSLHMHIGQQTVGGRAAFLAFGSEVRKSLCMRYRAIHCIGNGRQAAGFRRLNVYTF